MDFLLEPVLEVFSEYEFETEVVPSYVKFYSKCQQDVVMVYLKIKNIISNAANNNYSKTSKEEFELTGSPLKLDLSLHTNFDDTMVLDEMQLWLKEEMSHGPVEVEKARKLLNFCNELLQENKIDQTLPMWVLCDPSSDGHPLLLTIQSYKNHFRRGIVNYEGYVTLSEIDIESLIKNYMKLALITEDVVNVEVDCKFLLGGMTYDTSKTIEELLNAPHGGSSSLFCDWTSKTLQTPLITCKVNLEQEVIIGHLSSPCHCLWKSVCALYSINQLLVDMTAAGFAAVNLDNAVIRRSHITLKKINNDKRLSVLLKEVEIYTYMVKRQKGGFICVTDNSDTLKQSLDAMTAGGSSNDFTYRLWDILKDCETAEELITLLIQALKIISSGKMKPFIDANNKTYLGKLVLKLSRGHSQTAKVLKNLRANPPQALSLVGQVGVEKTMWEYTHLMSRIEHSFFIAGIWTSEVTSNESIEQINQTIYDMTMGGDYTMNPFDNKSTAETSIRINYDSFNEEDENELTVNDFESLKKLGVANDNKGTNEVPLIVDEIDISGWKNLLMKFSQVHICLEHLNRAQQCLGVDFATLKPIATLLREYYVADRSPIKAVGQLMNEPIQSITLPIDSSVVKDHLKKPAFWYRIALSPKCKSTEATLHREVTVTHAFSQQPVFPPSVWQRLELPTEDLQDGTLIVTDLNYYSTKYIFLANQFASKVTIK